jgi:hypothetical protein
LTALRAFGESLENTFLFLGTPSQRPSRHSRNNASPATPSALCYTRVSKIRRRWAVSRRRVSKIRSGRPVLKTTHSSARTAPDRYVGAPLLERFIYYFKTASSPRPRPDPPRPRDIRFSKRRRRARRGYAWLPSSPTRARRPPSTPNLQTAQSGT